MNKLKYMLATFMQGRYGPDDLYKGSIGNIQNISSDYNYNLNNIKNYDNDKNIIKNQTFDTNDISWSNIVFIRDDFPLFVFPYIPICFLFAFGVLFIITS